MDALRPYADIQDDTARQLKYVLDISNTGFVSVFRFGEFLSGFGPLRVAVQNVVNVLAQE